MVNRFSTDIARGDVRHWGEMADTRKQSSEYFRCVTKEHVKIIIRIFSKCHSGGGNVNRRYPDGYLLEFTIPLEGRHPRERYEKR